MIKKNKIIFQINKIKKNNFQFKKQKDNLHKHK